LGSALQNRRLHHAYIFHGPSGVGKFTTACAFAKVLLCLDPHTDLNGGVSPCGGCESCRLMGHGTSDTTGQATAAHPDFHIVTKELARYSHDAAVRGRKLTSIPVDVLRESFIEPVYRAAQLSRSKVLVIDEAELLNPTGQNLLLKTLEEPPAGTYLILVTSSEDRLLMTIRSRCQRVAFTPLPDEALRGWLDRQSFEGSDYQKTWLIDFAAGSLGRAQVAMEYDLYDWARSVLPSLDQMARGVYPDEMGRQMTEYIDGFAKRWVDQHENASKEAANRRAAALLWSLIGRHASQKIAGLSAGCDPADPAASESRLSPWLGVIDVLHTSEQGLASHVNTSLVCDHLVSLLYRCLATQDQAVVTA